MPQAPIHASSRSGNMAESEDVVGVSMLAALDGGSVGDGSRVEVGGMDSGRICGAY